MASLSIPGGPLPDPNRRRRNAPTIPTTDLPASGRQGPPPDLPAWVELGEAGQAWWEWAWTTPQACAWGPGHEGGVVARARGEDLLADAVKPGDQRAVLKACADWDERLGLTPRGMAALRWRIVDDSTPAESSPAGTGARVASMAERRRRLTGDDHG